MKYFNFFYHENLDPDPRSGSKLTKMPGLGFGFQECGFERLVLPLATAPPPRGIPWCSLCCSKPSAPPPPPPVLGAVPCSVLVSPWKKGFILTFFQSCQAGVSMRIRIQEAQPMRIYADPNPDLAWSDFNVTKSRIIT
jgi:hypothetical protein